MTSDEKVIAAAQRWQAARATVRRLRIERSKFYCARAEPVSQADYEDARQEAYNDPLAKFEFPTPTQDGPCWKLYEDGPEDSRLLNRCEWCASCLRRQAIHEQYRAATKAHGAAMRALELLAKRAAHVSPERTD